MCENCFSSTALTRPISPASSHLPWPAQHEIHDVPHELVTIPGGDPRPINQACQSALSFVNPYMGR